MTEDRWIEIKQLIKDRFKVLDAYEEDLDPGFADVVEFETPQGKLKASFIRQPRVIGKKTLYSHRAGGDVRVDYTYSDTDEVMHLSITRWDEQHEKWNPIDAQSLF